ncbi:reverse transcriptase domain-containing protein [Tanacetum coccineum]
MSRKTLTPAVMAKEIKEMISQEVAKAQTTTLSHLKEYFGNIISQTIQEELNANFAGRVNKVTSSDFSGCGLPSYSRETIPFYVTNKFKMLRERLIQLLMNHYVDMLKKEIREFISSNDLKNMDEIMMQPWNENKRPRNVSSLYRKEGLIRVFLLVRSSSLMKPIQGSGGKDTHIVPIVENSIRASVARGALPAPKPCGAPSLAGVQRPQRPLGRVYQMMTTEEAKEAPDIVTEIDNEKVSIDLISMPIGEIDVVNGMDWLSKYDAIISCQNKLIRIRTPSGGEMFIYSEHKKTSLAIYLDSISVVREFPNVFPEELPGIPPDKHVEFCIDLFSRSTPVTKTPYIIAQPEMQELMK